MPGSCPQGPIPTPSPTQEARSGPLSAHRRRSPGPLSLGAPNGTTPKWCSARYPTRSSQTSIAPGRCVRRRFAAARRSLEMTQLPLSTSMATYSPWRSASTCGRMSRSYISSPKRAVSSRGRRGGMGVSLPWAGTVVSVSLMRPPSKRASVHGASYRWAGVCDKERRSVQGRTAHGEPQSLDHEMGKQGASRRGRQIDVRACNAVHLSMVAEMRS